MDSCSRGNLGMLASMGVLRDYRGLSMAGFGFLFKHHLILYAKLMEVCEGLDLAVHIGHFVLEVEFD